MSQLHSTIRFSRKAFAVSLIAAASLVLVGCSAGGGTSGDPSAGKVDTATAQALVDKYSVPPTEFPVDVPLENDPSGLKVSLLQCVTPTCGLAAKVFAAAGSAMGIEVSVVKVSSAIADQQSGLDSIIASKPDGVVILGIEASAVGSQIQELTSDGVAVTTVGLADVEQYGVQAAINSNASLKNWGQVLGAYAVLKHGADSDIVIYNVPELSFPPRVTAAAQDEIAALCPACVVRVVDIPITSVGTDSPSRVVSDLQANPKSNIAIFPFYDVATGLPAALSTADITIDTVGLSPSPSNLQDIKDGGLTAGVSVDVGVMFWTALDATARVALGEPITASEKTGIPPFQIVEASDITFDPAGGYHAFPDLKDRFTKLWTGN